jgi:glycosyltransferase involved in cell wall biosynthesis
MKLLVLGSLNASLVKAKVAPLLACSWVEEIVWINRKPGPGLDRLRMVTVGDGPLPVRSWRLWRAARAAARHAPPDLILAYNVLPFGLFAWALGALLGRPFALGVIGGPYEVAEGGTRLENRFLAGRPWLAPLSRTLALALLRRAAFVLTTGSATSRALAASGLSADRLHARSSVVDPAHFHPGGLPPAYDIVSITSLIPRKRPLLLLDVADRLRRQRPDLRMVVVGDGPLRGAVAAEIARRGLAGTVILAGDQADVRPYLWQSRLFLLVSAIEGLPLSIIEAMACGVPAVVGRVGDVADLIEDGANGRIVDAADPGAYERAAADLLADDDLRAAMAARAVVTVAGDRTVAAGAAWWDAFHQRGFGRDRSVNTGTCRWDFPE